MSLQLSWRLPVVATGDALERLSISLNNILGRLPDSVQSSRRFLADASHELRTLLTVIKGELHELSNEGGLSGDALSERVGSVLEEVARLEHLLSGLLALSRRDAGETQREAVAAYQINNREPDRQCDPLHLGGRQCNLAYIRGRYVRPT